MIHSLITQHLSDGIFTVPLPLYLHHEVFETFVITPSTKDSMQIQKKLEQDNLWRADIIKRGGIDPGRDGNTDWCEVRIRFCISSVYLDHHCEGYQGRI